MSKSHFRSPLSSAGFSAVVLTGLLSTGAPAATAAPEHAVPKGRFTPLVGLAAERILLADKVAAAKFGTTTPIEDPVREQQVLDQAAALAVDAGIDTDDTVEFFRAQIDMSKVVQRELHALWTKHPELAPAERPDLATEVRPELDRITVAFIGQLAATEDLRTPAHACKTSLVLAKTEINHAYGLGRLHSRALWGAIEPVCK